MISRVNLRMHNGTTGARATSFKAKVPNSVHTAGSDKRVASTLLEDKVWFPLNYVAEKVAVKPSNPSQFDPSEALKSGIVVSGDCLLGVAGATLKLIAQDDGMVALMSDAKGSSRELPVETKRDESFGLDQGIDRHNLSLPDGSHLQIVASETGQLQFSRSDDPTHFQNSLGANLWWEGSEFNLKQVSMATNGVGAIAVLDNPLSMDQRPRIIQNTTEGGQEVQRRADLYSVESKFFDSNLKRDEDFETTVEILDQSADNVLASNRALMTPMRGF